MHNRLAERFERFAEWCDGTSPLYARLARGIADDPDLLDLAAAVPEDRSPPHLLLAAVHFLLLDGAGGRLADYYPTVVDDPADPGEGDPVSAFSAFCRAHRDAIREFVTTHRTQTNAVRRCAALRPAFEFVAGRAGEPLSIVEAGTSAGLNLLWDRYRYEYDGGCGPPDFPVVIESAIRGGDPPLSDPPPTVTARVGIDLAPLDVRDSRDRHVLRSFVWPEHADRHRLIGAAAGVVSEHPPRLVEGDAAERLPAVLADLDDPVAVVDTQTLYQMDAPTRERYRDAIAGHARERDVHWLSGSGAVDDREHGIALRWGADAGDGFATERVAVYEQHGRWIEWLGA